MSDVAKQEVTVCIDADLWRDHRAKTYYQDGLAAAERAERTSALATEINAFVVGRSSQDHECLCGRDG